MCLQLGAQPLPYTALELVWLVLYWCCNPFLGPRIKNKKIQKNQKYMFEKTQKIITMKKGCQSA
jgi:hypothetical protein